MQDPHPHLLPAAKVRTGLAGPRPVPTPPCATGTAARRAPMGDSPRPRVHGRPPARAPGARRGGTVRPSSPASSCRAGMSVWWDWTVATHL